MRGGRDRIAEDSESTAEAMRSAGVPEHLIELQCAETTDFPLWPENTTPVRVWCAVAGTQWNAVSGMDGTRFIGLRYEALPVVMDSMGVKKRDRADLLSALRIMERAALKHFNAPARR